MIVSFGDRATEDLFHGVRSNRVRRVPANIVEAALVKLDVLNAAHVLEDLRSPPGNRLEAGGDLETPIRAITARPSLPPASFTRYAIPRTYAWATQPSGARPRAYRAYHVPQVAPTNGGRVPLYTGGYHACAGRPLKPTEPDPRPVLALEPLSRLSSALVTMRNREASLS